MKVRTCQLWLPEPPPQGFLYKSQYLYLLVKVRTAKGRKAEPIKGPMSQYLYLLVKVRTSVPLPHHPSWWCIEESQYLYLLVKVRT